MSNSIKIIMTSRKKFLEALIDGRYKNKYKCKNKNLIFKELKKVAKTLGYKVLLRKTKKFSAKVSHNRKVISVNNNMSVARKREFLAHEIGHILDRIYRRDHNDFSKENLLLREDQANEFADCILQIFGSRLSIGMYYYTLLWYSWVYCATNFNHVY